MPCILDIPEYPQSLYLWSLFFYGLCKHGSFTFVRHNALRNITAKWLSKACYDVAIEPPLQPHIGEIIEPKTANHQDEARADIHAREFWEQWQSAFFDIRVFYVKASSCCITVIPSLYQHHELQKKTY